MSYQEDACRTESSVKVHLTPTGSRLLHAGVGIATEAGEFLDAMKKSIFYGKPLDSINLIEELGDLLWYIAIASDALETTIEDIQDRNIAKLRARYPDKFTPEKALTRDLETEREVLENRPSPLLDIAPGWHLDGHLFNLVHGKDERGNPTICYQRWARFEATGEVVEGTGDTREEALAKCLAATHRGEGIG